MTTEEGLLSQWYKALHFEDSLEVMAFLAAHPSLLKVGWGPEASDFVWKGCPWKQRTALHVGVRRGNAALVEQVLNLCKVPIRKRPRNEEEDIADPPRDIGSGEGDLPPATKWSHSAIAAQSLVTGERHGSTNRSLGAYLSVPRISSTKPDEGDTNREMARLTVADWKRPVVHFGSGSGDLNFRNAVSSIRRSNRDGDEKSREIAWLALAKWKRRVDDSRFLRQQNVDQTLLCGILNFKDEEYELNVTATAVLHGNCKIILLLLNALREHEGIVGIVPSLPPALDVTEERAHRAELRAATELVARAFAAGPCRTG